MIVEAPQGCQQNANVDPRLLRFAHVGHLHAGPVGSVRQLAFGANRQIFANDVSDLDDVAQHLPLMPLYRCIAERPVEKRNTSRMYTGTEAGESDFISSLANRESVMSGRPSSRTTWY